MHNQNSVPIASDTIYKLLLACGWNVLNQKKFNFATGTQLLLLNNDSLPFVYSSTGKISRFIHWLGDCLISDINQMDELLLKMCTTTPFRVYIRRLITAINEMVGNSSELSNHRLLSTPGDSDVFPSRINLFRIRRPSWELLPAGTKDNTHNY